MPATTRSTCRSVRPVVTRVERYAGHCRCCGATTLAPVPEGLEPGTPFSINIVALAMYLRFVHAISYQRLTRLLLDLFGLAISEGALDAAFRRGKPQFDADVAAILARLRRARVIYSDETGVRIDGRGHWNWVFQNAEVVIHVVRPSRGAAWWPRCWTGIARRCGSPISMARSRDMPMRWQVCLAHQLRDCQYAIEAGDAVFAPRMKALLLRAVVLARRHRDLAESTRREYRRRLDRALDAVMALAPTHAMASDCAGDTARSATTCSPSSTIPRSPPTTTAANANCGPPRPIARSPAASAPTGGPTCSPPSAPSSAPQQRRGIDAYQAIRETLRGQSVLAPG